MQANKKRNILDALKVTDQKNYRLLNDRLDSNKLNLDAFKPIDDMIELSLKKVALLHELKIAIAAKKSKKDFVSIIAKHDDESGLIKSIILEHDKPAHVFESYTASHLKDCLHTFKTENKKAKEQHKIIFENLDLENNLIKSIERELKK